MSTLNLAVDDDVISFSCRCDFPAVSLCSFQPFNEKQRIDDCRGRRVPLCSRETTRAMYFFIVYFRFDYRVARADFDGRFLSWIPMVQQKSKEDYSI